MRQSNETPTASRGRAEQIPAEEVALHDRVRSLRLKSDGPGIRPRSAWLPWGLTVIACTAATAFGLRAYLLAPADAAQPTDAHAGGEASKPSSGSYSSASSNFTSGAPAGSSTTPVGTDAAEVALDSKGYVIAAHQIQLSPQVGGEIIWLDPNFKEGAVYKKGDRLAEVDPVIYAAQRKSAEAALRAAEINLREVESGSALQEIAAAKAMLNNMAAKLELARIDERNKRRAGVANS